VSLCKSAVKYEVVALDVAKLLHFFAESLDYLPINSRIREYRTKPGYPPHLAGRLLRNGQARPNRCHPTEKCNELSPPHTGPQRSDGAV
jgi:hypothetical protein